MSDPIEEAGTVGRRKLRKYRLLADLSPDEFAAAAGISADFVRKLEAGTRSPGLVMAFRLQRATKGLVKAEDWQ